MEGKKVKIYSGVADTNPGETRCEIGVFLATEHENHYELSRPVYVAPHFSTQYLEKNRMDEIFPIRDNVLLTYSISEVAVRDMLERVRRERITQLAKWLEETEATTIEEKIYG